MLWNRNCKHTCSTKVLRDSAVRGCNVGLRVKKDEKATWRLEAKVFLTEAFAADAEDKKTTLLPLKLDRLASFNLLHANERMLQGQGMNGYIDFYPESSPRPYPDGMSIDRLPLLIQNMDSGSQNMCSTCYLCYHKRARMLPVWDVFHKRSNMTMNAYKEVGIWPSLKLQSMTFEINRGPFKGYAWCTQ